MELITVSVRDKASRVKYIFDVHAVDKEQAVELVWHVVEEEFGGKLNDYEFKVEEIVSEPRVVSYGESDSD